MTIVRGPVRFLMGSPPEDPTGRGDQPIHDEVIGRSFAVSTKEVTLRQYRQFAPAHLPEQNDARSLDLPVGMVSVRDAMDYCQWLNGKEGLPEDATCYVAAQDGSLRPRPDLLARTGYRLATEAEWEYACRAGTTTRRHFGHSAEFFASYAWYAGHGDGLRQPVGVLLPNDLGMFDMYGNVAEWCQDPIGTTADEASAYDRQREPCVYRGGDDTMSPDIMLRSSARAVLYGSSRNVSVSFRIARTIPQTSNEKTKRSE
jgi:formylglycine-generating enzyme required for sulfatase activity